MKTAIVGALGETAMLLPALIQAGLRANDRIKQRLALLQEAAQIARAAPAVSAAADPAAPDAAALEISGAALRQARLAGETLLLAGAGALLAGLRADLAAMLAPLNAADAEASQALAARAQAIQPMLDCAPDQIELGHIAALTGAARQEGDTFHLLVMDLHKSLNRLAAATAEETVDGAQAHALGDADRQALRAFMRGLHRTAPLAFGHPGLGTIAMGGAEHLTIQNEIGTTDAHVLVIHVAASEIRIIYTDVHHSRACFFMDMFRDREVVWSPLRQRDAAGLREAEFYLVNGGYACAEAPARERFLEFLGSRLVFLIDWNKARKALQHFTENAAAIRLLADAAADDFGHRGFLKLGGAELIYEAVQRAASGRIGYGQRLDAALGEAACTAFLRFVLRATSQACGAGRSPRLLRDELQAELSRCLESAEGAVFTLLVRHLGLTRGIAEGIEAGIDAPDSGFARRAKQMEAKADRLTATAREMIDRMQAGPALRLAIDEVENTTDALEDCAHLLGLAPPEGVPVATLSPLAGLLTGAVTAMVQAVEAASHLAEGQRADAEAALRAIDTVLGIEREADAAEREVLAALMRTPAPDARGLLLQLEVAKTLEQATDCLSHAAYALRDRVLEELAA